MKLRNTKKAIGQLRRRLEAVANRLNLSDEEVVQLSHRLDISINQYYRARWKSKRNEIAAD